MSAREFVLDDVRHFWMDGGKVIGGGVAGGFVPAGFVARLAGGADGAISADELPDEPVAGFDPDVGRAVHLRLVVKGFEDLGEEPLDPDRAAVTGKPRLVSLAGDVVDAIGLGLGAV